MFDKIVEDGRTYFLPVWSGEFLEYIDLSKISFYGVIWDGERVGQQIVYKNTNAKIKLFEDGAYGNTACAVVRCCDFSGTILSAYNLNQLEISSCNFEKTGTKIFEDYVSFEERIINGKIQKCSFKGLNLAGKGFSLCSAVRSECDFAGTGLKFDFFAFPSSMPAEEQEKIKVKFGEMLDMDFFKGCYINEVLVTGDKEQKDYLYSTLFGYTIGKYEGVLNNIKGQILNFAKKGSLSNSVGGQ